MPTMHAGHLPSLVSDYSSGYQQYAYNAAQLSDYESQYAAQNLPPLQPPSSDCYKSATESAQTYQDHMGQHLQQYSLPPIASIGRGRQTDAQYLASQTRNHHAASQTTATQRTQHDERAIGGVSANLDYDMDAMTEFVAEMAAGMYAIYMSRICIADIDLVQSIKPGITPPSTFRKWVLQVLNATRLPSATIILSLSYLSLRVRGLSANGRFLPSERSLYQMLTVALILGSKFLDDNTFQNKSWAEVSNISVIELNRDERDWLTAFDHRLHHDPQGLSGFTAWEAKWFAWQARLAPYMAYRADGSLRGERSMRQSLSSAYQQQVAYGHYDATNVSRASDSAYAATPYSVYDSWNTRHSLSDDSSPSTAPQSSGPQTPDYYNWPKDASTSRHAPFGFAPLPSFNAADLAAYSASYALPAAYQQAGNMWNNHGGHCQCGNCRAPLGHSRYGTVVAA